MSAQAQLKPLPAITWGVELITPAEAAYHLKVNINNRPIRKRLVASYASEMRSGNWPVNGQDIIFSDLGRLLDGQHRLLAIIEVGIPVLVGVKRGVPTSAFATLDTGAGRTAHDVVSMSGMLNAAPMAASARLILAYSKGQDLNTSVPKTEVSRFCVGNELLEEVTSRAKSAAMSSHLNTGPLGAVIYLANRTRKFDQEVANFLEGVKSGANLDRKDPRLTLRDWAVSSRTRAGQSLTARFGFAAVARCWTAYANHRPLATVQPHKGFSSAFIPITGYEPF